MSGGGGQLELTWSNKDMRLLAHGADTYEWVDPTDWRVSEVRLLEHVETIGEEASGNLLIQGDALHALTALSTLPDLAEQYRGKVKLCYIDPPFNTGQTFTHYDDAVEHSVWLTMLRDRLRQIHKLLSLDGSVWVHLDDAEAHRARCVLDEVFGAEHFVATVVWERTDLTQMQADHLSVRHDFIHIYRRSAAFRAKRFSTDETPDHYDQVDPDDGRRYFARTLRQTGPGSARADRPTMWYPMTAPDGTEVWPIRDDGTEGRWRWGQDRYVRDKALIDWRQPRDRGWDPQTRTYWAGATERPADTIWTYKEVGSNRNAKLHLRELFGPAATFDTPKPETLLGRIIELSTDEGDLVLDCFAGSGTTAATAHKMGRRWLTVELQADNVDKFVRPRLRKVVGGEDAGGITSITVEAPKETLPEGLELEDAKAALKVLEALTTGTSGQASEDDASDSRADEDLDEDGTPDDEIVRFELPDDVRTALLKRIRAASRTKKTTEVRWKGGGGFDVVRVGPSMFEEEDGTVFLAEWATGGALAEAVCAQLGYTPEANGPFAGRKGRSRLAVIDGMLTAGIAEHLAGLLDDRETLMVVAQALEPGVEDRVRELRRGSRARKVPRDLARVGILPSRLVRLGTAPDGEDA